MAGGWLSCGGGGFGFGLVVGGCGKLCGDAAFSSVWETRWFWEVKSRTDFIRVLYLQPSAGGGKWGGKFAEFRFYLFRNPSVRKDI